MSTDTDRELLECAAKAAGIDAEFHPELGPDLAEAHEGMWLKGARTPDNNKYWNPLTDDGDALRLAVKLGMGVIQWTDGASATLAKLNREFAEPWGDDQYAATRRAIVRAAAAIGKAMP